MLRWLARLLVLAVIAVVGVMIVSRLTNREEDFDDYDDLEGGFDFQETPVEIEVPAEQYAVVGSGASSSASASSPSSNGKGTSAAHSQDQEASSGSEKASENSAKNGNGASLETTTLGGGENLTDIVGIGPAFDARLKAIGINTMADLAQADANSINEQVDVIGGVATVEDWIAQAKSLMSSESSDGNN